MGGKLNSKIRAIFLIKFEKICMQVLIEAYNRVIQDDKYNIDWEEEQFNQELIIFMRKSKLRTKHKLTIGIERKLFNENELPINDNNPKKLPRIDINIVSWAFADNEEFEYFFEAKNLSEKTWYKKSGAKVDASYYQRRYIETGIENFRTGRYYNGSLIGYVLEGKISTIIEKINNRLKKDTNNIKTIEQINYIKGFPYCYKSQHLTTSKDKMSIKHIFLKF